jgi:hypothetical protein
MLAGTILISSVSHNLYLLIVSQSWLSSKLAFEKSSSVASLPAQIGCLGRHLIDLLEPWVTYGRAVSIESPLLCSRRGVWHKKHRQKGEVAHTSIDSED